MSQLKESEHSIQGSIIQYLKLSGFKVWRVNSGRTFQEYKGSTRVIAYGEKGMPDVMAIKRGYPLVCIECKSKTGKATDIQNEWLEDAKQHGAIALVANDIDQVIEALKINKQR